NEHFETLITNHKDLNKLLNEKDIAGFSSFSKPEFEDSEFKTYIEERYISSFKEIYNKYTQDSPNDAKVNALLRSLEFLATPNTINAIEEEVNLTLNISLETLKECKTIVDDNVENLNPETLLEALNNTTLNICNKLNSSQLIKESKDQVIAHSLYINDVLKDVNPKYQKALYVANEELLEKLKKIDGYHPSQKAKYLGTSKPKADTIQTNTTSTKNANKPILEAKPKKKTNYWVYIILAIVLFAVRMCAKMD
uniref:hypothetical protein n=1 Tax=Winogradskyella sp. TaxID=1883156 RepID=UPI00260011C9